jgi:hypothetical protein
MKDIIKVAQETVIAQIGNDRGHGWGKEDQYAVVSECLMADVENHVEACKGDLVKIAKYTPSEMLAAVIAEQLNGSAFRQSITATKKEKRLLDEGEGRTARTFKTFAKFAE